MKFAVRKWLYGLSALVWVLACGSVQAAPRFETAPELIINPSGRVPLAAMMRFRTQAAVTTHVEIDDGKTSRTLSFAPDQAPAEGLPLLGLRPDTSYRFTVAIEDGKGARAASDKTLSWRTPPLPADSREWPQLQTTLADPQKVEPGIVIFSLRRQTIGRPFRQTEAQRRFTEEWGRLVAVNERGEVVWVYESDTRIAGVEALKNGHLLFHLTDFSTVEIDMLGRKVAQFYPEKRVWGPIEGATKIKGIQTLHHQPHETSRGTFLSFSANVREIADYYTSETDAKAPRRTQKVVGDTIIEFDRDGNILWEWNAFDHLPLERIGYDTTDPYWWIRGFPQALDWTHGNGVTEDLRDGNVIFYLKHQDAMFKVDKKSGEIIWIFGEPSGWPPALAAKVLKKKGAFAWPYHAHNPRMTGEGTLILYENGAWGARPFTGRKTLSPNEAFSRAAEYRIDEKAMTVEEIWTSHRKRSDDTCHSPGMGDAHRLPRTGNLLVVDPACFDQDGDELTYTQRDFTRRHVSELNQTARIRQYSHTEPAKMLFELAIGDFSHNLQQWQVYGGVHVPSLYFASDTAH